MTNTTTDLIFKINLNGDPTVGGQDWGKYTIGIDSTAGGDTTGDGWARPISISSGMDYWVGSWVDSGNGAQIVLNFRSKLLHNALCWATTGQIQGRVVDVPQSPSGAR